jgi:hypothetical protein
MFSLKKKQQIEGQQPEPDPVIERPKPKLVIVKKNSIREYEEIAKTLDFEPKQLLQEQILRFLSEHNIAIFDYEEVYEYLKAQCKKDQRWIWVALRKRDKEINLIINGGSGHGHYSHEYSSHGPYNKLVPLRILKDVKKIEERFEGSVGFYVSDFENIHIDDPFIMLKNVGMRTIIFGMWDEPDFGI